MIRLRRFAASARQVRFRRFAASARRAHIHLYAGAVMTVIGVMLGGSAQLLACPSCFGAEETSMIDGTKLGIVAMLGFTFAVQGGFLGFFVYLRRRARRIADVELDLEWSELQRGSRRS